jgi:hypothetical protein
MKLTYLFAALISLGFPATPLALAQSDAHDAPTAEIATAASVTQPETATAPYAAQPEAQKPDAQQPEPKKPDDPKATPKKATDPKAPKKKPDPWPTPTFPEKLPTVAPKDIDAAIQRSIALLISKQEAFDDTNKTKSEWPYEGVYRVAGSIPIGYRIGGTSICAIALLEAAGAKPSPDVTKAVMLALDFVLARLDDPLMAPDFVEGYDVRGWGHAYGLSFLMKLREMHLVPDALKEQVEKKIHALVEILQKTELHASGGWNYSRPGGDASSPSTFMTAPTLQILFEAAKQGEAVDAAVVERGLASLADARLDTGAFQYGTNPKHKSGKGIEEIAGSTGRSPICETTLFLAGRGSVEHIQASIDQFFANWQWLEQRRKQSGTHIGPYAIAPYFFIYAHRYCAQAIEFLPEDKRAEYRTKLYQLLWHVREEDGGWNDRVFERSESFGTAMTILALEEPKSARPAGWPGPATKAVK